MRFVRFTFLVLGFVSATLGGFATDPSPDDTLRALASRQKELLGEAVKKQSQVELEDLRQPIQQLCFDYEDFLRKNPSLALGYVSYAMLLDNPIIDERKQATAMLLKANQLDPEIPLVKNQLGNHVAEMGKPLDALNYFLAAVRLAPKEPLYHYQLGTLMAEARDDFLKSGEWTRPKLDQAMQSAFMQASAHSPDDWRYAYRYGLSFYDVEKPDWDTALKFWSEFENRLKPGVEQQTCRIHQARIHLTLGETSDAKEILVTITEPALAKQKTKLETELAALEK